MSTNKLSVIIVNYNSSKYTAKLIKTLKKINKIIGEIIIIDNNSKDSGLLPTNSTTHKLKVVLNTENFGFSKAVNQGINLAINSFILLINPDCLLTDTSVITMFNLISSNNKIGAVGGRIIDPNTGTNKYTANGKPTFLTGIFEFTNLKKIFPNNIYTRKFWIESNKNITEPTPVFSLCGAFIIFRKIISEKIIKFDEDYFLYLEDMQFGLDINHMGYKVIFDPRSKVIHYGGKSNNSKYKTVLKYWYDSRIKYFSKNLSPIQGKLLSFFFKLEELILKKYHKLTNTPNE